jgi:hypothetical protein
MISLVGEIKCPATDGKHDTRYIPLIIRPRPGFLKEIQKEDSSEGPTNHIRDVVAAGTQVGTNCSAAMVTNMAQNQLKSSNAEKKYIVPSLVFRLLKNKTPETQAIQ